MEKSLRGLPNCPRCGGKGVILPDWNIRAVAIVCNCTSGVMPEPKFTVDIEESLKECSLDRFLKYWMNVVNADRSLERIEDQLNDIEKAVKTLDNPDERCHTVRFLERCQNKIGGWNSDLLLSPDGFNNAMLWAKGRLDYHIFFVIGEPHKGKTFLLASLLMDRCRSKTLNGKFIRCRALSQYIKNATWGGYKSSQRYAEMIDEILDVDVLALDDLDKIDEDEKVAKVFMMIFSERMSTGKPTLISYDIKAFVSISNNSVWNTTKDKSVIDHLIQSQKVTLSPYFDVQKAQAFVHQAMALKNEQK